MKLKPYLADAPREPRYRKPDTREHQPGKNNSVYDNCVKELYNILQTLVFEALAQT